MHNEETENNPVIKMLRTEVAKKGRLDLTQAASHAIVTWAENLYRQNKHLELKIRTIKKNEKMLEV